jgi:AcrR family transcriptional regulator
MTSKSYRLGLRQDGVNKTRARIVAGARALLHSRNAVTGFSVEAVARSAGVTRSTVYHQFKSKLGLLNAIYDGFASHARLRASIAQAFCEDSRAAAIQRLVVAFCRMWAAERTIIRRLHALAEVAIGFPKPRRDEWRRTAIRELLSKWPQPRDSRKNRSLPDVVDALHMLTSFETYDGLARDRRSEKRVVKIIAALALTVTPEQRPL